MAEDRRMTVADVAAQVMAASTAISCARRSRWWPGS